MATSFLRKRRLQAPFVVTVAAAATVLLPGCGGKSAAQPSSGDGGSGDGGDQCPPDRPAAGSPCSGNLECGDPCSATYGPIECVNGAWMDGAGGCNPPATVQCPSTEPAPGSACSVPSGQPCGYQDPCTSTQVTFWCMSGVWQEAGAPDGPVPCPATTPAAGSSCAACAGRWPSECDYGPTCNGSLNTAATCDATTGTWSISVGSCNPPQFFDGGPDAAVDGSSDGPSE
jgi:hypothetical protein